MLRFLFPYAIVSLVLCVATAVGYGSGLIGVAPTYAGAILAGAVLFIGHERWDDRQRGTKRTVRPR